MTQEVRYERMRPAQLLAARAQAPIVYVPIGPMEWHGPHIAVGTDMLHGYAMAMEAVRLTGGGVLPPLPIGTETFTEPEKLRDRGFSGTERIFGMDYPGFSLPSLYTEESATAVALHELLRALKRQAYQVIVIANGHGAANHRAMLQRVVNEAREPGRVEVLLCGYMYDTSYREHAAIGETSFMLAYHPEGVNLALLPPAPVPLVYTEHGILDRPTIIGEPSPGYAVIPEWDPRNATAARGRADVAAEATSIAGKVRAALASVSAPTAPVGGASLDGAAASDGANQRASAQAPEAGAPGAAEVRYERMLPSQIVAARARAAVAYVPIGPLEWHGPHLPYGVDPLHAHVLAVACARETGGVVFPMLPLGTETLMEPEKLRHRGFRGDERMVGMDFPAFPLPSLYVEEGALGVIVREIVRGLRRQDFGVIVLVNGHGAANHRGLLARIALEESRPDRTTILLTGSLLDTRIRAHAELRETSYMATFFPETVDLSALPPYPEPLRTYETGILDQPTLAGNPAPDFSIGREQDPRLVTPDHGHGEIAYEKRSITAKVAAALAARRGA